MRRVLSAIAAGSVLVSALAVLVMWQWDGSGGSAMSVHGYIALALGAFFTFALTAGLMALVFYSSRQGYDDEVGNTDEIDERIP